MELQAEQEQLQAYITRGWTSPYVPCRRPTYGSSHARWDGRDDDPIMMWMLPTPRDRGEAPAAHIRRDDAAPFPGRQRSGDRLERLGCRRPRCGIRPEGGNTLGARNC